MRLREAVSSQRTPLQRLIGEIGVDPRASIPAEIGRSTGPASDRAAHRANRKLQPDELLELADRYRRGASIYELADHFGIHRQTVSAHLRRAGVAARPSLKMTPRVVDRATQLYREGMSTVQIGKELNIGTSTVGKALKRAGVEMRPPVANRWK
ncbi:helix-turn-helix domain-containing protein [Rhodococcus spelaei]|uniref:helix-turn-helix domain-containing protein n=1 Tax=Rhodococcus spelaei TaxID=2546320 RepID=UPI003F490C2C